MNPNKSSIKGVCFGEVLWDNLPSGRKLGGAPLNVAYHLNKLGVYTDMLTRIGDDQDGYELIARAQELSIPTGLFQYDTIHPTSTVEVTMDENKDVKYEIVAPVAWDFISCGEAELHAVREADFFVYGSLSARNAVSYTSLQRLLKDAKYKVMDVNLRAPHYTRERILELMAQADLVKMNEEELHYVADCLGLDAGLADREKADQLMIYFQLPELLVTYGAAGAVYHSQKDQFIYHFSALHVQVKDTVGSGDSFLAAFLSRRCNMGMDSSVEDMLEFAATLSAFVTQSNGACPDYSVTTINRFQWLNPFYKTRVANEKGM